MTLPKISIITSSFNQGNFLEETILSVIDQNYPDLEYIIIDGGSTDHSVDIIRKHEHRIHYWSSEKDNGQSAAINKGLKLATGEIVAWLNSDDTLLSGALNKAATIFLEHPLASLIYGNVVSLYPNGQKKMYSPPSFEIKTFLKRVSIHQPGVFWKRKLHADIGLLDERLFYLMDYDLWMRIFFNYECLKVDETFSQFRIHPDAKTAGNPKGIYLEYRKVLSRFFNSFHRDKIIKKLLDLGIYDNKENKKYSLTIECSETFLQELLEMYIQQCAVQEYSFRNVKHANKLFIASMTAGNFFHTLEFLIKNNLRVRHITSLFR